MRRKRRSARSHGCDWLNLDLSSCVPSPRHDGPRRDGPAQTPRPGCGTPVPPPASCLPCSQILSGTLRRGRSPQVGWEGPCTCRTPALCQAFRGQGPSPSSPGFRPHHGVQSLPLCVAVWSSVKGDSPSQAKQAPSHVGLLLGPPYGCLHKRPRSWGSLLTWVSCFSQHALSPWLRSSSVGERGHWRLGSMSPPRVGTRASSPPSLGPVPAPGRKRAQGTMSQA